MQDSEHLRVNPGVNISSPMFKLIFINCVYAKPTFILPYSEVTTVSGGSIISSIFDLDRLVMVCFDHKVVICNIIPLS